MSRRGEEGFVLVAVLWFAALLALAAVIVEGWVAASLGRAAALQDRAAAERALIGAASRVTYAAVTGRLTVRGLEQDTPVAAAPADIENLPPAAVANSGPAAVLDGRAYRLGNVVVFLQDEAGLYDLSRPSRDALGRLLRGYGIAGGRFDALVAALTDYAAKRSDTRATAARDADYSRAGLPPPRHAPLLTPWEPLRVLGWQELVVSWRDAAPFADFVSTGPAGGLNPNTAPPAVFAALTGLDERGAARFVAYRAAHPVATMADMASVAGIAVNETLGLVFIPSSILRLKLATADDPLGHISTLRLTPQGAAPYRVDYAVGMPQDAATQATIRNSQTPAFPIPVPGN